MQLSFWFEFASTYSYPAAMRIEALAAQRGVKVDWRAFLLGPIFRDQGWNDSPFNIYPAKGRYMWRDLDRICTAHGIPMRRPSQFPRNGLLAARVACWFAEAPWLPDFVRAVYRANFAEDRDISSPEVVARCLSVAGGDPAALIEEAQSAAVKERLRSNTEEAIALGIFGAPSLTVGSELFWGHDRIEDALRWAVARPA
jgi:2-hydroxychromene-2-carboxylate isomerase